MESREWKADIVVVGGGITAAVAACKVRESGANVLLVDKGNLGRSGVTAVASGVVPLFLPGDDDEGWVRGESSPLTNHKLFKNSLPLMEDLRAFFENAGVKFVKDGDRLLRAGGARIAQPHQAMLAGGGPQLGLALRGEVLRRGVKVINRVMITGLLTSDGQLPTQGRVIGAIGFDTRTGEGHVFRANAVIMACGPLGHPYAAFSPRYRTRHMPIEASSEGIHAMWETGAILGKLEIGYAGLGPAEFMCAPGIEMLTSLGGHTIWINGHGERFMSDNFRNKEWGRSAIQAMMMREYREGRGPVGINISHFKPEERRLFKQVVPIVTGTFEAAGYDLTRDSIPFTMGIPAEKGTAGAGARVNQVGETSVAGLYAAGNCSDGAYICLGQTLTICALTGWRAGEAAGKMVMRTGAKEPAKVDPTQVSMHEHRYSEPLSKKKGLAFEEASDHVLDVQLGLTPTMNASNLSRAQIAYGAIINGELPNIKAANARQLARINGLKLSVPILSLVLQVMEHRTESRGNVVRDDYRYIDNDEWLVHTVAMKTSEGQVRLWDIPVPEDWWIIPPKRGKTLHPYFEG